MGLGEQFEFEKTGRIDEEPGQKTRVTAFSNGTDFADWRHVNCDQCVKDCPNDGNGNFGDPLCDIEEAISFGSISDGKIDKGLADRANLPSDGRSVCSEFVGR